MYCVLKAGMGTILRSLTPYATIRTFTSSLLQMMIRGSAKMIRKTGHMAGDLWRGKKI